MKVQAEEDATDEYIQRFNSVALMNRNVEKNIRDNAISADILIKEFMEEQKRMDEFMEEQKRIEFGENNTQNMFGFLNSMYEK